MEAAAPISDPGLLFINKMDQEGTEKEKLLEELRRRLDERCLDFGSDRNQEEWMENLAMCDEHLLEKYLKWGTIETEEVMGLIESRSLFPCYFGSALKLQGVEEFYRELLLIQDAGISGGFWREGL